MYRAVNMCLAFVLVCAPVVVSADVVSELRIGTDGVFSGKNLVVMQKAGNNIFARATWGQAFVRTTLLLGSETVITKRHGESATVADVREGDRVDVDGTLSSGAESLIVTVKRIRDNTLLRDDKTLSGTILSVNKAASTFVLKNKSFGTTTVSVPSSFAIIKGARTIFFPDIAVGDTVLSTSGSYDHGTNTLSATTLEIYQNPAFFKAKNFEGTLETIGATTLPTTLSVRVGSASYTVYLAPNTKLLTKTKTSANLSRFVVGDTVRFFGAIRKTNLSEVDAEVVRDLNF